MKPKSFALPLAVLFAVAFTSCSRHGDGTITVGDDDAEMNAAIAKARETLPEFWKVFEKPSHGESDFALKVEITDKDRTEHFWTGNLTRKNGKIEATIDNEPEFVTTVKLGQRITVAEKDISDWMYMRDGKMKGNYTLRVLVKHMSAKEAAQYKEMLADP